jgi:hypothetical protein
MQPHKVAPEHMAEGAGVTARRRKTAAAEEEEREDEEEEDEQGIKVRNTSPPHCSHGCLMGYMVADLRQQVTATADGVSNVWTQGG